MTRASVSCSPSGVRAKHLVSIQSTTELRAGAWQGEIHGAPWRGPERMCSANRAYLEGGQGVCTWHEDRQSCPDGCNLPIPCTHASHVRPSPVEPFFCPTRPRCPFLLLRCPPSLVHRARRAPGARAQMARTYCQKGACERIFFRPIRHRDPTEMVHCLASRNSPSLSAFFGQDGTVSERDPFGLALFCPCARHRPRPPYQLYRLRRGGNWRSSVASPIERVVM
jgi:hypothetical protein